MFDEKRLEKVAPRERGLKRMPDGRWRASWYSEGTWVRRVFPNKATAKKVLDAVRGQLAEGKYIRKPKKERRVPFGDACRTFLAWSEATLRPSTYRRDRGLVAQWLSSPIFTGKALQDLTTGDVERYKQFLLTVEKRPRGAVREMADGRWAYSWCEGGGYHRRTASTETEARAKLAEAVGAPSAVRLSRRSADLSVARLKRMFALCMRWGLTSYNPAEGVDLFREDRKIDRVLQPEEEARLLAAADAFMRDVVLFALNTGMRRGEILGLRWHEVDLKSSLVRIPAGKAKGGRERFVPLNDVARAVLVGRPRALGPDALVFPNGAGNPETNLEVRWRRLMRRSAVRDLRFHDLRHTFASRLVMAGVELTVVRELLGHADFATTLRYAHLAPSKMKEAVKVLA